MTTTTLAPRLTISEVVRVYEAACAEIREGYARIAAAEQRLNDTFTMEHYASIHVNNRVSFGSAEQEILRIRHEVWGCLIGRLGVKGLMSVARAKELDRQIEKLELPEITEQSVAELVRGFQSHLPEMLAEAVEEVFAWLRPRRSEYKRNSELEVPERIVLRHMVEPWSNICTGWRVNYHHEQNLIALENVLHALDGRGMVTKTHYSAISNVIRAPGFDGKGETDLFKFSVYKNGNMHLAALRLDLIAKFNAIAGGRRLRPATAAE